MADAISNYGYRKTADATSLNSASLSGFPAFVRLEGGGDTTSTGPGGLDSNASIDGPEDIGFFDENDNPVDFHWVTFDTTNDIYEAWVRTDLVRDGSIQLKVGYGSGSTDDSVAESTVFDSVPDLIARLPLDGDANDSTSNNHDGNLNGVTSISDGPFQGAFSFGSGDYIDVADNNQLDLVGRDMTMIGWMRTTDTTRGAILRKNNSDNWQPVYEMEINNGSADDFRMMNANNNSTGGADDTTNVSGITDGNWHFMMSTYDDSAAQGQMYSDGTNVLSPTGDAPADDTTGALQIGRMAQDTVDGTGSGDTAGDYIGDLAEIWLMNGVKSQEWAQTHHDMSGVQSYSLFSWNASQTNTTVSQSQPGTVNVTGTPASNYASATSNSEVATVNVSGTQAITGTYAISVSGVATTEVSGTQASNYASATSNSGVSKVEVGGLVASQNIVEAPKIPFNKPRAEVTLIESENDNEHTLISTADGSDNFLKGDIDIDGSVKSAIDGFSFTLSNPNDRFDYISVNDEVEIKLGYNTPLTTVMRGLVTAVNKKMGSDGAVIEIEGADFGQILQQRTAAEVYLGEDMGDIVRDLIVKYASEIDTTAVQDPWINLDSFRLAYETLFDAIKKLADRADYQFYVDNDRVLHFEPKGFAQTTKTFEQGGIIKDFSSRPNKKKLINEAIVFGGKQNVREQEAKDGDGSKTVFNTTYKPHDPDVYVDGDHLQGGAKDTTNLDEVDYVYDMDTREFEFAVAPSSGSENVEINYSRAIPIQAISQDLGSIAEYGRHQKQQTDQNIQKQSEAKAIADSLVEEFSEPPEEAEATIVGVHELKAGQSVEFDVPELSINSKTYPIVAISYTWGSSGYEIELTLNEEPKKLSDILKGMKDSIKTTQGFDSGVLDLIRKIQSYTDEIDLSEGLDVDNRQINDSFILGHPEPQNSELGTVKLGDRRSSYTDLITK